MEAKPESPRSKNNNANKEATKTKINKITEMKPGSLWGKINQAKI